MFLLENLAVPVEARYDGTRLVRVRQLISMLRDLVLTQRWQQVPDLLSCLVNTEQNRTIYACSVQGTLQSVRIVELVHYSVNFRLLLNCSSFAATSEISRK